MFQDRFGNEVLEFPCVRCFPLESMHLIDGGVIKDFLNELVACCCKASDADDEGERRNKQFSIVATELDEDIEFFKPFSLSDQNRKLR
jgi:hypothetical protein